MNLIKLVTCAFKTVFIVNVLLVGVSTAYAGDENCWAEFFQHSGYAGPHFRLAGPVELNNLQNRHYPN